MMPIVTAESAILNVGQKPTLIKSVTWPYRRRSVRLPIVPPRTKPSAIIPILGNDNGVLRDIRSANDKMTRIPMNPVIVSNNDLSCNIPNAAPLLLT